MDGSIPPACNLAMLISKKKLPENGDTRCVTRFAWLPIRVDEGLIWLELYESHEECLVERRYAAISGEQIKTTVTWFRVRAERIYIQYL